MEHGFSRCSNTLRTLKILINAERVDTFGLRKGRITKDKMRLRTWKPKGGVEWMS
jgi:hypothetical protein